ncbi:hypothetical protein B0T13DRAFT_525066 [Neurospora crassa]|nr:hypothetical protein B0T13DRAFT_525066 [Neurospora crassa]
MLIPRKPRATRDTISLPNPVAGRLMTVPRPTLATSIVTACSLKNISRPSRPPCPGQHTSRSLTASSRPSGPHNIPLPSSRPQDVPLPASSSTLASTSYATSYAGTDSFLSGATILAQAAILPGNNTTEEEGESSTAVVDRKNDPEFRSPEAYLGLPLGEIVEGPEYFLHPWHKVMKESTDFPFFMFNAIRYPAKSLNKAAAEVFPWEHVETIRDPWLNDGKLMRYDDSVGHCVEQPCEDVSKLDKGGLFGFTHEVDGWLDFLHEDTKCYVKSIKDIQAQANALQARVKEIHLANGKIYEELSSLRHKLKRVRGLNVLVGTQRFLAQARENELEMQQEENNNKRHELLLEIAKQFYEYERIVSKALYLDSIHVSDLHRAEAKRQADDKAKQKEQERLMSFVKLQSQKYVEEEAKRQHKQAKARATSAKKDKAKGKGKGKAAAAADFDREDDNNEDDTLLADLELTEPQTLFAAGQMLDPMCAAPHDNSRKVPAWFPIFDGQQIVPLRSSKPHDRFYELMVKFAELHQKAKEEKKKKDEEVAPTKKKPLSNIVDEFHDPHPEWPTSWKREHGGWWLCDTSAKATAPEKACKLCPAARRQAIRGERENMARGIYPEDDEDEEGNVRTAKEQYDEIKEAMDLAMAQAQVKEVEWLRGEVRSLDEEAKRVRKWKEMSFEEKRKLGFH